MAAPAATSHRDAYVELLKRSITNYSYLGGEASPETFRCVSHYDLAQSRWKIDPLARPVTLLNRNQLDLVHRAVLAVEQHRVPGDFIEAGVWRGGVIIFMRALLDAYGIPERKVVAADSFAGIPKNVRAIGDPVDQWRDRWVASLPEVQQNIRRFGVLDERISFAVGFFEDSLKHLAGQTFAIVRLDSDSYDSVESSLAYLYPQLADGGVLIIDDWHLVGCQAAVMNYRARYGITEDIHLCDGNAYWVKGGRYTVPPLA